MNKTNIIIDTGILVAFLVAMEPGLTGIPIHEWFASAFAWTIIVHLLLHWKWIIQVGQSFAIKIFHSSRLKFVVDALLWLSFITVLLSGLLISRSVLPFLPDLVGNHFVWTRLHAVSASAMLLLVGLHIAFSWDWITGMIRRYVQNNLSHFFYSVGGRPGLRRPVYLRQQQPGQSVGVDQPDRRS